MVFIYAFQMYYFNKYVHLQCPHFLNLDNLKICVKAGVLVNRGQQIPRFRRGFQDGRVERSFNDTLISVLFCSDSASNSLFFCVQFDVNVFLLKDYIDMNCLLALIKHTHSFSIAT